MEKQSSRCSRRLRQFVYSLISKQNAKAIKKGPAVRGHPSHPYSSNPNLIAIFPSGERGRDGKGMSEDRKHFA